MKTIEELYDGISNGIFIIGGKESGKTHTFLGSIGDPGLLFYLWEEIWTHKSLKSNTAQVWCSIFGFNNDFKDMLATS